MITIGSLVGGVRATTSAAGSMQRRLRWMPRTVRGFYDALGAFSGADVLDANPRISPLVSPALPIDESAEPIVAAASR